MKIRKLSATLDALDDFDQADDLLDRLPRKTFRRLMQFRSKQCSKESRKIGKEAKLFTQRALREIKAEMKNEPA